MGLSYEHSARPSINGIDACWGVSNAKSEVIVDLEGRILRDIIINVNLLVSNESLLFGGADVPESEHSIW